MAQQKQRKRFLQKSSFNVPLNSEYTKDLPALHPDKLASVMPTAREEAQRVADVLAIAETTNRSGAGGVIPGQVGLRPMGMTKANKFLEDFTETGKVQKKERPLINLHGEQTQRYDGPKFKVISLPMTFCIMCGKKDRNPNTITPAFHPIIEPNTALNLAVGDIVRGAICTACWSKCKEDARSTLKIQVAGQLVDSSVIKQAENYAKMDGIIKYVLSHAQLTQMDGGGGVEVELGG